jgi:hypothetical protein
VNAADRVRAILLELGRDGAKLAELPSVLVDLCSRSLPVTGVGLTLMTGTDDPAGLVAASDGLAVALDDLQFTLGEGPCVDASSTGRPVLVPELASTDALVGGARWPVFGAEALALGARAVFAFPLRVGAVRIGALDLYRDRTGPLPDDDVAEALAFTATATAVLLHLQARQPLARSPEVAAQDGDEPAGTFPPLGPWTMPLAHDRAVVHQATGMVSVTAGVGIVEALVLLRARAWTDQRPVDEVALDVVAGRLYFGRST